eukprot:jgi/Botrbrau1/23258/Bobra.0102s0003.1
MKGGPRTRSCLCQIRRKILRIARILRARIETLELLGKNELYEIPLPTTAEECEAVALLHHSVAQKSALEYGFHNVLCLKGDLSKPRF